LKLARKSTGRARLVAFEEGFHGRTLGSLSTTWNPHYRKPYLEALGPTTFVPLNDDDATARALAAEDVAAVIVEPIQSMAGMVEAQGDFLVRLKERCKEAGTLLIFDEVQTGVGRTGTFSVAEQLGVEPDLITMAKSLGSGIPVGAVLTTGDVARTVESGDQGTTFGGGMVAMAAVIATLETIDDENLMARAVEIFDSINDGLADSVVSVRGRGCLIGIELDKPVKQTIANLRDEGVLVGSSGNPCVLRLMPPLNTPDSALDAFLLAFQRAIVEKTTAAEA
ncbi:MAG: aminotransferase class III-fold pyridoxal phosphate-dependent enzyme, partial [Rhodothermales bacterium]|nr:aminotransferase class III-fold pyridoxal phosphate-dependent enzyme [Rhodothermales bacterium]